MWGVLSVLMMVFQACACHYQYYSFIWWCLVVFWVYCYLACEMYSVFAVFMACEYGPIACGAFSVVIVCFFVMDVNFL